MNEGKDVSDAMLAGKAQAEATSHLENMLKEALTKKVGPEIELVFNFNIKFLLI